jgi:hypothetical protein
MMIAPIIDVQLSDTSHLRVTRRAPSWKTSLPRTKSIKSTISKILTDMLDGLIYRIDAH